jgi:predicted nucleic acid-binding protein
MSADTPRVFVDTNVLVYAHDSSSGEKRSIARDLLRGLWLDGSGCLSVQVLQEFYLTVTRRISQPLAGPEALAIVHDLAAWTMHTPDASDVETAIRLHQARQLSFWDAMLVHSALRLRYSILWTEDLQDVQQI